LIVRDVLSDTWLRHLSVSLLFTLSHFWFCFVWRTAFSIDGRSQSESLAQDHLCVYLGRTIDLRPEPVAVALLTWSCDKKISILVLQFDPPLLARLTLDWEETLFFSPRTSYWKKKSRVEIFTFLVISFFQRGNQPSDLKVNRDKQWLWNIKYFFKYSFNPSHQIRMSPVAKKSEVWFWG